MILGAQAFWLLNLALSKGFEKRQKKKKSKNLGGEKACQVMQRENKKGKKMKTETTTKILDRIVYH